MVLCFIILWSVAATSRDEAPPDWLCRMSANTPVNPDNASTLGLAVFEQQHTHIYIFGVDVSVVRDSQLYMRALTPSPTRVSDYSNSISDERIV